MSTALPFKTTDVSANRRYPGVPGTETLASRTLPVIAIPLGARVCPCTTIGSSNLASNWSPAWDPALDNGD